MLWGTDEKVKNSNPNTKKLKGPWAKTFNPQLLRSILSQPESLWRKESDKRVKTYVYNFNCNGLRVEFPVFLFLFTSCLAAHPQNPKNQGHWIFKVTQNTLLPWRRNVDTVPILGTVVLSGARLHIRTWLALVFYDVITPAWHMFSTETYYIFQSDI